MNLDEQLRTELHQGLDRLDVGRGDPHQALAAGTRIGRRRSTLRIGGAAALAGAVALTAVVALRPADRPHDHEPTPPVPTALASGWTKAAPSPLTPRIAALMVWTGDDVLVMGGYHDPPCPPTANCVAPKYPQADAAAYDPSTDEWHAVASPPIHVYAGMDAVVSDGVVVIGTARSWWTYHPAEDRWRAVDTPASVNEGPRAELDGKVYTVNRGTRTVSVLDVGSESWSTLPPNNLAPPLTVEGLFATPSGVVLSGVNYDEAAPDEPTLTQADIWDGQSWSRLPRTGMTGWLYYWTGKRILGIERGRSDGGRVNNWGQYYPAAGALDPATGDWEPLPGLATYPRSDGAVWSVEAASGPLVATGGRVYNDTTRTWTEPGVPDSAVDLALSAAWADGSLVFFGGYDEDAKQFSNETWVWTP